MDEGYVVFGAFLFDQGASYFEYGSRKGGASLWIHQSEVGALKVLRAVEGLTDTAPLQHALNQAFRAGQEYERQKKRS